MRPGRTGGFSLIEVLVAVTLLAVVGVLGYRGLDQVRLASARLGQHADEWQTLAAAFERIGNDLRQALPPALSPGSDAAFWQLSAADEQGRRSGQLSFVRPAWTTGEAQRVAYRWEEGDGGDGGTLWLLLWSGREETAAVRRLRLLDGLRQIDMACLDRHGTWRRTWSTSAQGGDLPRAIRFELVLPDGRRIERIFDLPAAG